MSDPTRCPRCGSENTRFSRKHSRYDCEDCLHEFVLEKPFVPRRLFISYGHDEHVSLAMRLRDDLRERGHHVWFDEDGRQVGGRSPALSRSVFFRSLGGSGLARIFSSVSQCSSYVLHA